MTDRFIADTETLRILDTETGLYLGFTFAEATTAFAAELNDGTVSVDDPYTRWTTLGELPTLTEDELIQERLMSITLAAVMGIPVPDYAQAWFENYNKEND